jgi:hypothetical protein
MADFDIADRIDRDIRHCRTRAFAARLFASHPLHHSNAPAWERVARAWEELASLRAQVAVTNRQLRDAGERLNAILDKRH